MPTPSSAVAPALRVVVDIWADLVEESMRPGEQRGLHPLGAMSLAVHLLEQDRSKLSGDNAELVRRVEGSPLARRDILDALRRLLESDTHLMSTCRNAGGLARALELLGLDAVSHGLAPDAPRPDVEELVSSLAGRLFESDYRRGGIFHIDNMDLPIGALPLGGSLGPSLVRLSPDQVAPLANEATASSRIHGEGLGDAFVRFVDAGEGHDSQWMTARWQDAYMVVRVLRFLKYQIVNLDWGGIHYSPEWVNQIRKYGITLWGRPRCDRQPTRFTLDATDQALLVEYLTFYVTHRPEIDDLSSDLRKATSIAGDYYESHHSRTTPEDKLIDLVISLEALFSSREGEHRFRIAQSAALLLGVDAEDRRRLARLLRRAYDARSALVHGSASPFQTGKFITDELAALGEAVRVAILRLLTLHMRGHRNRDAVLTWLSECALDPERRQELIEETDFRKYLAEQHYCRRGGLRLGNRRHRRPRDAWDGPSPRVEGRPAASA